jgi:DtxR family Mn-dependent transcriptional regulator
MMSTVHTFGESTEMYLKTIGELSHTDALLPISDLANRLGISPVSATEMVHRMVDQGLVEHERYQGIRLTMDGTGQSMAILRRHRLWERFLYDKLSIPWADVHDFACLLEHSAGDRVSEALATFLDQPATCPHGNPIPNTEGHFIPEDGVQLDSLRQFESGIVLRVRPESQRVLSRLSEIGVEPGRSIQVTAIDRHDDLWSILSDRGEYIIGKSIAACVVVKR